MRQAQVYQFERQPRAGFDGSNSLDAVQQDAGRQCLALSHVNLTCSELGNIALFYFLSI
jgi:hypothetical protein